MGIRVICEKLCRLRDPGGLAMSDWSFWLAPAQAGKPRLPTSSNLAFAEKTLNEEMAPTCLPRGTVSDQTWAQSQLLDGTHPSLPKVYKTVLP